MLNTTTVTKLREMKLSMMADAFQNQLKEPSFQNLTFEERFGLVVDQEWATRKSNRLKDLIKKAGFDQPGACIENIDYFPDRKLDRELITKLSSCNYIREHHNILLLGATGCGKTYLACALGISAARNFFKVKYVRLQDLLTDLQIARGGNTFPKAMQQYKKPALLIIDEWMRYPLSEMESRDVLEIADARYHKGSTILCSQFDVPGWMEQVSNKLTADAICDRFAHDSHKIIIAGDDSMRKRKSTIQ